MALSVVAVALYVLVFGCARVSEVVLLELEVALVLMVVLLLAVVS